MKFGARLREKRKAKGIKQIEMSRELGISPAAYTLLEQGETGRTLEKLPLIAKKLDCRIDDLFPEMDVDPDDEEIDFV